MTISFTCPHCQKAYKVKDEWAGKKATCSNCQKKISIPATKPAASSPKLPASPSRPAAVRPSAAAPTDDVDAIAAAAFADEPPPAAVEPAATATMRFNCPQCDDSVEVASNLAGKKAPCPSCGRIIRVPEPTRQGPKDWRKAEVRGPSGAKKAEQPAMAGAWGSTTGAATVSQEALEEAGAIKIKREPWTTRQKINFTTSAVLITLLVGGIGWLTWSYFRQSAREAALAQALAQAEAPDGLAPVLKAEIFRSAGVYYTRAGDPELAQQQFEKALGQLADSASTPGERDALLIQLALAEADLWGTPEEIKDGTRLPWAQVQKLVVGALAQIGDREAQTEAVRVVSRKLLATKLDRRGEAAEAMAGASDQMIQVEELSRVAMERLRDDPEQAKRLAERAREMYWNAPLPAPPMPKPDPDNIVPDVKLPPPPPPPRPPFPRPLVAILLATNQIDKIGFHPTAPAPGYVEAYALGFALRGDLAAAEKLLLPDLSPLERLRALADVADAADAAGKATAIKALVESGLELAVLERQTLVDSAAAELKKDPGPPPPGQTDEDRKAQRKLEAAEHQKNLVVGQRTTSWLVHRLAMFASRAGVERPRIEAAIAAMPDPGLRGLAQVEFFRDDLETASGKAGDADKARQIGVDGSLARAQAWEALARYGRATKDVVAGWPAEVQAFGKIGVALAMQGKGR